MLPSVRFKLSLMMFLQYIVWGAWAPTAYGVMTGVWGFSDGQAAACYATTSLAAMLAPFFVGLVADRFFAAQKILGVLHLLGAGCMFLAARETDFSRFYPCLLAHTLFYMPTLALSNSVAFARMSDPGRQFAGVRVLGTIGWIMTGLLVSKLGWDNHAAIFQLSAAASLVMGLYSFWLPHTPARHSGGAVTVRDILGLDALSLLKDRSFAVFILGSFLICIPLAFYYNLTGVFLTSRGIEKAAGTMTFGQISEVLFMLAFPFCFARLGVKWMMVIGMAAWALRYFLFAWQPAAAGASPWPMLLGVVLHGICYDFFFVTGQVYVDGKADEKIRSAAQGLIAFVTYGLGMFVGSYIQGQVTAAHSVGGARDWERIWMVPACGALGVLILFVCLFQNPHGRSAGRDR